MKATHTYLHLFLAFLATAGTLCAESYRAGMYGVVADGKTDNAEPLQEIIDHCSESGGGTVVIETGTVVSATFQLKSNVTLKIAKGAVLKCTDHRDDYPFLPIDHETRYDALRALIHAQNQKNIAIIGKGVIDGNSSAFDPNTREPGRVSLIRFDGCRNVTVKDVNFRASSMWTQHYYRCDKVRVSNITVDNMQFDVLNDDGITIDCCHDVQITDSRFNTHDDAIVLKNTYPQECRDVTIDRCVLNTRKSAFKIGTDSDVGFINITAKDLQICGGRDAVTLQSVDGALIKNVLVENVTVKDSECPIFVRLGSRLRKLPSDKGEKTPGSIEDVTIRNLTAKTQHRPFRAIMIAGIEGHRIKHVLLENIDIEFRTLGGDILPQGKKAREKDRRYPASTMFGLLPAWGLFVRHADRVALKNVTFESIHGRDPERMVYTEDMGALVWE